MKKIVFAYCDFNAAFKASKFYMLGEMNMNYVETSRELSMLRPVIEQWISMLQVACTAFPQSKELWYNERTLSALLSAASWRLGIPSIIEAKVTRSYGANRVGSGHFDAFLKFGDKLVGIESKIRWYADPDGANRLFGDLDGALEQAASLPSSIDHRVGVAFAVLEGSREAVVPLLQESVSIARARKPDLIAFESQELREDRGCYLAHLVVGKAV